MEIKNRSRSVNSQNITPKYKKPNNFILKPIDEKKWA